MQRKFEARTIFSITNPNKGWVVQELDNLRNEWAEWLEVAQNLGESSDYDPQTCTEAIKDGFANRRKHEVLREKTLVFIGNSFSGYEFLFENWPHHPHEDNTSRLAKIIPGWVHRLETLSTSIEYARVPDDFWKSKGKQLVDEVVKAAPDKAVEIADSYLKNPTSELLRQIWRLSFSVRELRSPDSIESGYRPPCLDTDGKFASRIETGHLAHMSKRQDTAQVS